MSKTSLSLDRAVASLAATMFPSDDSERSRQRPAWQDGGPRSALMSFCVVSLAASTDFKVLHMAISSERKTGIPDS
jgi:hypothetical protein